MSNNNPPQIPDFTNLTPQETQVRRREWNRGPLLDLFPRIPSTSLDQILDLCMSKSVTYNLSTTKSFNSRRLTCIVIANVRHKETSYDELLKGGLGRWDARARTSEEVWKVLRAWCPWDESNRVLEECFRATLLRPEDRGPGWDPMDVDGSDYAPDEGDDRGDDEDPMDLD